MEQTNRTILFEEINPEKEDLLTLIIENEKRKGLNDEEIFHIHEKLEVGSYEEFLLKFEPSVRMQLDTQNCTVNFNQDIQGTATEKISFHDESSLLNGLIRLIDAKKKEKHVLTSFEDMRHNIIPKRNMDAFISRRNEICIEAESHQANEKENRERLINLIQDYNDGVFLLEVFIQDMNYYAKNMHFAGKPDKGILDDKGRMQIKVVKRAASYRKKISISDTISYEKYKYLVADCMRSLQAETRYKNQELMQACLLLPVLLAEKRYYELEQLYSRYYKLYEEVIKKFWIAAKPLIETALGVREFFSQYQGKDGMAPRMVVANFKPVELIQPENRNNLELYLNTVNMTSYQQNVLWYAIIPNIAGKEGVLGRPVRERFVAKQEQYHYKRNEMEEVTMLVDMLGKYKIQSFLSMALTQEHTFTALAQRGTDAISDMLQQLERIEDKDYCIPCFPNFIVIAKEDAYQRIGMELDFNDLTEKIEVGAEKKIWLDEIGIEASYIAAGLVAACQCPKYLQTCYAKGVDENLPGVAYRFTQGENYLKTVSGMLSETISMTEEMEEELKLRSKGILFGQRNGKMVVLTDRVLSYNAGNKLLISMVQTMSYIERQIQYDTQDFKKHLIEQFFQRRPGSTITTWGVAKGREVNVILRENEDLEYRINDADDSCTFSINFKNDEVVRNEKVSMFKE